jgi:hypothetical protein
MQSTATKQLLDNARNLASAAEFLASGKSTFGEWCIPGLLPKQGTAVIYGPTGAGKTFLTLHLALRIAGAVDWFGQKLGGGTVVYLAAEDRHGVEARAVAAAEHMGLPIDQIALEFLTPAAIHSEGWTKTLIEALAELRLMNERPIVAVFLDTLGASFGGRSQDEAAQMTMVTDAMQDVSNHFECVFVTVHHPRKNEVKGLRGSQVLEDRCDAVINICKAKDGVIAVNVEKQRNSALGAPLLCRLAPVEIAIGKDRTETTCVVDEIVMSKVATQAIAASPSSAKLSRDVKIVLDIIKRAEGPISVRKLLDLTRAPLKAAKDRKDGAIREALSHSKAVLLQGGYIEIDRQKEIVRIRQNFKIPDVRMFASETPSL